MGRDSQVLRETDREFQASLPGLRHASRQTQDSILHCTQEF